MSSAEKTYRIIGGWTADESSQGFLVPIFKRNGSDGFFLQICKDSLIVEFRRLEVDSDLKIFPVTSTYFVTEGDSQMFCYHLGKMLFLSGSREQMLDFVDGQTDHLADRNPALAVQIENLRTEDSNVTKLRKRILEQYSSMSMDASYAYKNSVAREVGWEKIEKRLASDEELLTKFREHRSDYDFHFGERGELKIRIHSERNTIPTEVLESALIDASISLDSTFDELIDVAGEEIQHGEYVDDFLIHHVFDKAPRQETRLALVLKMAIERPKHAGIILSQYEDDAMYANQMARTLGNFIIRRGLSSQKQVLRAVEDHLPLFFNKSFYKSRGVLLVELAKHLGNFEEVYEFLKWKVGESESKMLIPFFDEIEYHLRTWSERRPN
ncbi:MAG: hypothetical protein NXH78_13175 [Hyphomonadaceae bacterium]|nr:hypothetical protein [Hyphomonadaceae bacterium]